MRCLLVVLLVPVLCRMAAADELLDEPEIGPSPTMTARLTEKLTLFSNEVGLHLSALSANMVDLQVDVSARTAHLRLGGDYDGRLLLRVDSDVKFRRGGVARVKAKLDLGLSGRRLSFTLPDFDVVPRTLDGKHYLELRLPIFEGHF